MCFWTSLGLHGPRTSIIRAVSSHQSLLARHQVPLPAGRHRHCPRHRTPRGHGHDNLRFRPARTRPALRTHQGPGRRQPPPTAGEQVGASSPPITRTSDPPASSKPRASSPPTSKSHPGQPGNRLPVPEAGRRLTTEVPGSEDVGRRAGTPADVERRFDEKRQEEPGAPFASTLPEALLGSAYALPRYTCPCYSPLAAQFRVLTTRVLEQGCQYDRANDRAFEVRKHIRASGLPSGGRVHDIPASEPASRPWLRVCGGHDTRDLFHLRAHGPYSGCLGSLLPGLAHVSAERGPHRRVRRSCAECL